MSKTHLAIFAQMQEQKPEPNKKQRLNDYGKYSAMAFQMAVMIAAGVWGGYALDKYLQLSFPVFKLTLSLLAVAASIYFAVKDLTNEK